MNKHQDLIERIEGAGGPDRELDALIACAADARPDWAKTSPEPLVVEGYGRIALGKSGPGWEVKQYTESVDAAMTLVDPRALWAYGSMEEGPFARLCWPQPDGTFTGGYVEATAATVPLSICLAALKARKAAS